MTDILIYNNPEVAINSLKHIDDCKTLDLSSKVREVGKIIAKYNLQEIVSITRLHKHYDLNKGEWIIGTMNKADKKKMVTTCVKNTKPANVVARQWRVVESGAFVPLQWFENSNEQVAKMQQYVQQIFLQSDFCEEVAKKIIELGKDEIGIGINISGLLEIGKGEVLCELNDADRTQTFEVVPMSLEKSRGPVVETVWTINGECVEDCKEVCSEDQFGHHRGTTHYRW